MRREEVVLHVRQSEVNRRLDGVATRHRFIRTKGAFFEILVHRRPPPQRSKYSHSPLPPQAQHFDTHKRIEQLWR